MIVEEKCYRQVDNPSEVVSCIVITYNQRIYIYDCIKSILKQNNCDIELVISDDGTAEYSSEDIIDYVEKTRHDNLVRALFLHHESNVGTVRNINRALEKVSGKYIKIIGGDDLYPSDDVFAEQIKLMRSNPEILVVIGKIQDCNNDLAPVSSYRRDKGNDVLNILFGLSYVEARRLINKSGIFPIANQACCYKTEFFMKYGVCDEKYRLIEDTPLAQKILEHKEEAMALDMICVYHRNAGGITTTKGMFLPRRLPYYHDNLVYIENDVIEHPEVYTAIQRIEEPRVSKFIYLMTLGRVKDDGILGKTIIVARYFDAVCYFLLKIVVGKFKKLIN